MADFSKLKPKAGSKGEPPPVDVTNNNLQTPPRTKQNTQPTTKAAQPAPMGKIQFSVPQSEIDAFAQEAGKQFGFKKGSKSDLFSAMLEHWMKTKNA